MPYAAKNDNKETLLRSQGYSDSVIKHCLGSVTKSDYKVVIMPQQEKATIVSRPESNSFIKDRKS